MIEFGCGGSGVEITTGTKSSQREQRKKKKKKERERERVRERKRERERLLGQKQLWGFRKWATPTAALAEVCVRRKAGDIGIDTATRWFYADRGGGGDAIHTAFDSRVGWRQRWRWEPKPCGFFRQQLHIDAVWKSSPSQQNCSNTPCARGGWKIYREEDYA